MSNMTLPAIPDVPNTSPQLYQVLSALKINVEALRGGIGFYRAPAGAIPPNSVGAAQLQPNSVGQRELQPASVGYLELQAEAVVAEVLAEQAVGWKHLDDTLQALNTFVGTNVRQLVGQLDTIGQSIVEVSVGSASDVQILRQEVRSNYGDLTASVKTQIAAATGPTSAIAQEISTLNAALTGYLGSSAVGVAISDLQTSITNTNNTVTANTRIFLTNNNPSGLALGNVFVLLIVPGVSFTIASLAIGDTSDIAWLLVESSP